MEGPSSDIKITTTHRRLSMAAQILVILSWVSVIVYMLATAGVYANYLNSMGQQGISFMRRVGTFQDFLPYLIRMITTFSRGIIYLFTLQGISLGLRMLIEVDMNYQILGQEKQNG